MVAILGAAVVGGSTVVYLRTSRPRPDEARPTVRKIPAAALEPSPSPSPLVVHVAGMVASPGVYELAPGSRVTDALAVAGGALPGADLEVLNLAAPVSDGERIFISRPGQASSSDPRAPPAGAPGGRPPGKLNLNTASAAELDGLPGVGPVLARRILDFRQKKGRFASIRQLREVQGLGPKKYEAIKDLVTI
ncbi:MAG: helix-hairpin-helix domain-containing protein [Actinomycetota bacterium]